MIESKAKNSVSFIKCNFSTPSLPKNSGLVEQAYTFEFKTIEKSERIMILLQVDFYHTDFYTRKDSKLITIQAYYSFKNKPPLNLAELYTVLMDGFKRLKNYQPVSSKYDALPDLLQNVVCPAYDTVDFILKQTLYELYFINN
jgi:hypothetical protein